MSASPAGGAIALVLDSTADFPEDRARFPQVRVVPLLVRLDGREYRDYVDLGPEAFYARLREEPLTPTTSAPPPQAFADAYAGLLAEGYEQVISLHIAGSLSATLDAARIAAQEHAGRVHVVDSRTASAGIGLCVLGLVERLAGGASVAEAVAYAEGFEARLQLLFSVETLEYLQRGGRIGRARALLGNVLAVRPLLRLAGGEIEPVARTRGTAKALARIAAELEATTPADAPIRLAVAHADAAGTVGRLLDALRGIRPGLALELVSWLGPVIGTYAGPGAFGVGWVVEEPTAARASQPIPGAAA